MVCPVHLQKDIFFYELPDLGEIPEVEMEQDNSGPNAGVS